MNERKKKKNVYYICICTLYVLSVYAHLILSERKYIFWLKSDGIENTSMKHWAKQVKIW